MIRLILSISFGFPKIFNDSFEFLANFKFFDGMLVSFDGLR